MQKLIFVFDNHANHLQLETLVKISHRAREREMQFSASSHYINILDKTNPVLITTSLLSFLLLLFSIFFPMGKSTKHYEECNLSKQIFQKRIFFIHHSCCTRNSQNYIKSFLLEHFSSNDTSPIKSFCNQRSSAQLMEWLASLMVLLTQTALSLK